MYRAAACAEIARYNANPYAPVVREALGPERDTVVARHDGGSGCQRARAASASAPRTATLVAVDRRRGAQRLTSAPASAASARSRRPPPRA